MPAAQIAEQMIAAHRRYIQIVAAIVIVIADGHSHPMNLDIETTAARNIGECPLAVIPIKGRHGAMAVRNPVAAVQQQDVELAVAIRIKKCYARTHRFGEPLPAGPAGIMGEMDSRRGRHIGEMNIGGRGCGTHHQRHQHSNPQAHTRFMLRQ